MAALPNRSVRIDPAHNDILNEMLDLLRRGRAEEVDAALRSLSDSPDTLPVGPFRNAAAALDFLVGRMVSAAHPQAIWLFGSRAAGTARPDSDFDLMAILPDDDTVDVETRRARMAEAVMGAGVGVDVTACRASDFARFRDTAGSLVRTVHEQGREIYVSRPERRRRLAR
ncbi:MAG: nucleotidyltransferase domain-containing protein [Alphaproteobacteria bacterium]|nr:nucleotidyltransferase domain-containing protein [Alphaproteobacteria bacterium]